jgi:hypothetical protein
MPVLQESGTRLSLNNATGGTIPPSPSKIFVQILHFFGEILTKSKILEQKFAVTFFSEKNVI